MVIKEYLNEDVKNINLDESSIIEIKLLNSGNDIEMEIDWCGQEDLANQFDFNSIKTKLFFEFVCEIEISLKSKNSLYGGISIDKFEMSFLKENNEIAIIIESWFQPIGLIKFHCFGVKFVIEDLV